MSAKLTIDTRDYEKGLQNAIASSKNVKAAMDSLRSPLDKAKSAFEKISHPIKTAKDGFQTLKDKAEKLAHPIQNFKSKMAEAAESAETQRNRMHVLASAYDDAKSKVEQLTKDFNDSVRATGATSEESKRLAQELKKAEDGASTAEKEMNDYADSVKKSGKESDDSESKFKKFANTLKKTLAGGAKIAGAALKGVGIAVGAAAAGVGKIVKDSVQAYGEYEQLKSGTEKIFSGMDMSVITKDANEAYKTLNMSASQYYESINRTGSAFKASMGDQKAYETAKIGMKAIADFASGTGKDLGELNEKYAMITRSTSSYQSIADQFSGLLPQTSADFLKQAQAAGLLSGSYKTLTEVPVAEYQEAVTKMLAKGTEALNLQDNALNESTGTLTGSFAMTKAAWQNFVTGLADPTADLGELTENLISSATAALKNIVPLVQQALSGIGKAVKDVAPTLIEQIGSLVSENLPGLLGVAIDLVSELVQAIIDNADQMVSAAFALIDMLVEKLSDPDGLIRLIDAAFVLISKLADGLVQNLPTLIPAIVSIITEIAAKLYDPDNLMMLVDSAIAILLALADGLISSIDVLLAKAPEIVIGLVQAIIMAAPKMIDAAFSLLGKLGEGIHNALSLLWEIGKGIVQGIWQGITNSLEWIKGKIKGWVGNVMTFIKGLFGIHSPSKWAQNMIGKNLVLGMAEGIMQNEDAVLDAMDDLNDAMNESAIDSMGNIFEPDMGGFSAEETLVTKMDDEPNGSVAQILSILNAYLPGIANQQIILDSGALVGNIGAQMDAELGRRTVYAGRRMA